MSSSPHKIRFAEPLREARVKTGRETFLSETSVRDQMEEKFRTGFEAGQKSLREELVTQRTQILDIQNNILRSIEKTLPAVAAACEKDLISLAVLAARRVVQETPISAEQIEALLKKALAEIQGTTEYQVRLNPEDFALLQTVQSPALPSSSQTKVNFVADATIARAGCQIHTKHGAIEFNRERAFQKLEEAVL